MSGVPVAILRLPEGDPAIALPDYATAGAAGADVRANLREADRAAGLTLAPGARALVPTGFALELPPGFEAQMRPRSGLALKDGITLVNSPGTIDEDYRGEVGVILVNHGGAPFIVTHGMRIAQLVLGPVVRAVWRETAAVGATTRGAGGFGSTGRE